MEEIHSIFIERDKVEVGTMVVAAGRPIQVQIVVVEIAEVEIAVVRIVEVGTARVEIVMKSFEVAVH